MTTVVSVDPVYVYASVDEDTLLKFNRLVEAKKLGNTDGGKIPVDLQLADESEFPHHGPASSRLTTSWIPTRAAYCCARCSQTTTGALCPAYLHASAFR